MFMNPGKVTISSPEAYPETMASVNVMVDIEKRRQMTATTVSRCRRNYRRAGAAR
jgi:glycyl-tRNA synthetase beta subunit